MNNLVFMGLLVRRVCEDESFRGFGRDHLSRGCRGSNFRRMSSPKKAYHVRTLYSHDSLKQKEAHESLRNPEHGTLTLMGTPKKGITIQRIRCWTLMLLISVDNLSRPCLFVRR